MNLKKRTSRSHIYNLSSYFYALPSELIAQSPLEARDHARLMIIDRHKGSISHDTFKRLGSYLPKSCLFVLNNTRVIPARLIGHKTTGGTVEVFLLNQKDDGYSFEALVRPLKKLKEGQTVHFTSDIHAVLTNKEKGLVRFNKKNILQNLQRIGHVPLPPYIKRPDNLNDRDDYQTVYARKPGSVASPTAGLHFTKTLLNQLKAQDHQFVELTLHINYGTFKPVESEDIRQHIMHKEYYAMTQAVYKRLNGSRESRPIIAVGTTSCRVLETAAGSGILKGLTDLFIYPGYQFKITDILLTNFHLPYSSLLMLVCAFGGYDLIMKAYREAIIRRYRFYSYGDAMLIL